MYILCCTYLYRNITKDKDCIIGKKLNFLKSNYALNISSSQALKRDKKEEGGIVIHTVHFECKTIKQYNVACKHDSFFSFWEWKGAKKIGNFR